MTTDFFELIKNDKDFVNVQKTVMKIVKENRLIDDRINKLTELGFDCKEKAVGSGGVGCVREQRNGYVTIQISYGRSQWNYAWVVEVGFFHRNENNPIQKYNFLSIK